MSTINYLNDYRLYEFFDEAESITIFNKGKQYTFVRDTQEYENIKNLFLQKIYNAYEMPALSVGIDAEIRTATNDNVWLQFDFGTTLTHYDLPFDNLLINVEPHFTGVDIIRKYQNAYDGRCFYLNMEENLSDLYDLIINTAK